LTIPAVGRAETVLTVGMTAGDIPVTTGNPDQGFEGFRFVGFNPVKYEFNQDKARALLKEAACYPCKITLAMSTSGSGQMQPLPMNELVKSQMEAVGFQIYFKVMDWNSLTEIGRSGVVKYPEIDGYNGSRALLDPLSALIKPGLEGPLVTRRQQLGPLLRPGDRRTRRPDPERVRRRKAIGPTHEIARVGERPRAHDLGRA
jgi:hypothetical protein